MNKRYGIILLFLLVAISVYSGYFFYRQKSFLPTNRNDEDSTRRSIPLYYFYNDSLNHEKVTIVWSHIPQSNLKNIINAWLALLYKEHVTEGLIVVPSCALNSTHTEAYVSLSTPFLNKESSTIQKWNLLRSLFRSINEQMPHVKKITFFEKNKIMYDYHIDFSQGFFIEK